MKSMRTEVFENTLNKVKENHPQAYEFVSSEIERYEDHHYYHFKFLDCFRIAVECNLLPKTYQSEINALEIEVKKIVLNEVVGTWRGMENENADLNLEIRSPNEINLIRSWKEVIDGEEDEVIQKLSSYGTQFIECEELLIINLYFDESKRTNIRFVLYPAISYKKQLIGSLYFFQDSAYTLCSKVFFDKVENDT